MGNNIDNSIQNLYCDKFLILILFYTLGTSFFSYHLKLVWYSKLLILITNKYRVGNI